MADGPMPPMPMPFLCLCSLLSAVYSRAVAERRSTQYTQYVYVNVYTVYVYVPVGRKVWLWLWGR